MGPTWIDPAEMDSIHPFFIPVGKKKIRENVTKFLMILPKSYLGDFPKILKQLLSHSSPCGHFNKNWEFKFVI